MFGFFKRRRRKRILQQPFPDSWREWVANHVPATSFLSPEERRQLEGHIQIFLYEKQFEGCGGLEITDEIRVTIAAQACLLLLNRKAKYYPSLRRILVYPSSYFAKNAHNPDEVSHRLGESWQYGPVVLAWDASKSGGAIASDGLNVVIHEFAHQLDQMDGGADGVPILAPEDEVDERLSQYRTWARIFSKEFVKFRKKAAKRRKTVIDHYGATNEAEFFATATEAFFEKPRQLKKKKPDLYAELQAFYQQDPVLWFDKDPDT